MQAQSVLMGIKATEGEFEGRKFSSTTFYLPASFGATASGKAIGHVSVPYKMGDASEFDKWKHLEKSWPPGGVPVMVDFEITVGRDAQGRDSAKVSLKDIKPLPSGKGA